MPLFTNGVTNIPQLTSDPVSPTPGTPWVKTTGAIGFPGLAMGPLGLTYSRQEVATYTLSWEAQNGSIKTKVLD